MTEFTPVDSKVEVKAYKDHSQAFSLTKVLLWFGLGLLITGVIALCVPDLMIFAVEKLGWSESTTSTVYTVFLVISILLLLPSSLLVTFKAMRPRSGWMTAGYIVYCVSMGLLVSNIFLMVYQITALIDASFIKTVSIAFLATAGCFLLMGLFATITKKNLGMIVPFLFTLIIGATILSLVNFFMQVDMIFWIVDFTIFGVLLILSAIDIQHVKKMVQSGAVNSTNNLGIYCAYMLYTDFINIFIRVLYYVLYAMLRNGDR